MKEYPPIEFSLQYNPSVAESMRFRFPTAPAYLNNNYNQKCKVEFISIGMTDDFSVNLSTIYMVFNGIPSNQYRLLPIKDGVNLVSREFVNTPLSAVVYTLNNAINGANLNNGNILTNGGAYVVCNSVWGQEVRLEIREIVKQGLGGDAVNSNITTNIDVCLTMRITPFSEEC